MRAAVTTNVLTDQPVRVTDWPDPTVPAGWALVRLRAAALNRLDRMLLDDRSSLPGPSILGSDGAGVVAAAGKGADVEVGAEVVISPSLHWGTGVDAPHEDYEILGSPTDGTHAELVAVPAENLYPKPDRLTWREAAALPMAGVTAWRALVSRGRLQRGETVVVTAASSGLGSFALQIAAGLGARVVAVTSSGSKPEVARSLGADVVVLRDQPDFVDALTAATDGCADVALDPTGALWQPLLQSVRPGGRLVAVGKMASESATVRVQTVYWKQVDILGSSMGSPRDFAAFLAHVDDASWTPLVDSTHPLDDIETAYARLDSPARTGKVVIDLPVR